MMVDPLSAVKTNKLLEEKGMQVNDIKGGWTPTDKAKAHGEWMDTNKRHSDGTPVKQLKWFASALDAIGARSGMAVVHLRPPLVYGRGAPGNFALLWKAVRSGLPLPLGGLREPRSFVALDNLIDLVVHLVEREQAARGVHLVSDMQDLSTADFVAAIATGAGLPVRNWPLPAVWLRRAAALLGRGEQVDKLAVRLQVDSRSLSEELGWTPPFKVGEALRNALAPTPDSHKGT
jgi:nucleoside-diphosphate-sugar epimerase